MCILPCSVFTVQSFPLSLVQAVLFSLPFQVRPIQAFLLSFSYSVIPVQSLLFSQSCSGFLIQSVLFRTLFFCRFKVCTTDSSLITVVYSIAHCHVQTVLFRLLQYCSVCCPLVYQRSVKYSIPYSLSPSN